MNKLLPFDAKQKWLFKREYIVFIWIEYILLITIQIYMCSLI